MNFQCLGVVFFVLCNLCYIINSEKICTKTYFNTSEIFLKCPNGGNLPTISNHNSISLFDRLSENEAASRNYLTNSEKSYNCALIKKSLNLEKNSKFCVKFFDSFDKPGLIKISVLYSDLIFIKKYDLQSKGINKWITYCSDFNIKVNDVKVR